MAYDASERDDDDRIVIGGKQHGARSKPESVSVIYTEMDLADNFLTSSRGQHPLCKPFMTVDLF